MAKHGYEQVTVGKRIGASLLVLFALAFIASFVAGIITAFDGDAAFGANTAIIPVDGVLVAGSGAGIASSDELVDDLERAADDSSIQAVILMINSPGGTAVASDEVARAVAELDKPVVAVIREVGASGAYWVASASDHVVANRMSITGSIGVIASYLSFGEFLDDWNVTYNRLVSGERKDVGSPFRELTLPERVYLEEKLDVIHGYFVAAVAENRNLSVEDVRGVADGRWLLGAEAFDHGLVDELGGEREALAWVEEAIGEEPVTVTWERRDSLFDLLSVRSQLDPFATSLPMAR